MPKTPKPEKTSDSPVSTGLLIGLSVVAIVLGLYAWKSRSGQLPDESGDKRVPAPISTPAVGEPTRSLTPTPSPTPSALLQGKETYSIGGGSDIPGPKFTQAIFEPHDPKIGETQTITVKAQDTTPIQSVKLVVTSDKKQTTHDLALSDGTNTDGSWKGTWKVEDTQLYTYLVTIVGKDGKNESKVTITLRKP